MIKEVLPLTRFTYPGETLIRKTNNHFRLVSLHIELFFLLGLLAHCSIR